MGKEETQSISGTMSAQGQGPHGPHEETGARSSDHVTRRHSPMGREQPSLSCQGLERDRPQRLEASRARDGHGAEICPVWTRGDQGGSRCEPAERAGT